jgi:hypothetical protein
MRLSQMLYYHQLSLLNGQILWALHSKYLDCGYLIHWCYWNTFIFMWKHIRFLTNDDSLNKKIVMLAMFLFYIGLKTSSCFAAYKLPFYCKGCSTMILLINQ